MDQESHVVLQKIRESLRRKRRSARKAQLDQRPQHQASFGNAVLHLQAATRAMSQKYHALLRTDALALLKDLLSRVMVVTECDW